MPLSTSPLLIGIVAPDEERPRIARAFAADGADVQQAACLSALWRHLTRCPDALVLDARQLPPVAPGEKAAPIPFAAPGMRGVGPAVVLVGDGEADAWHALCIGAAAFVARPLTPQGLATAADQLRETLGRPAAEAQSHDDAPPYLRRLLVTLRNEQRIVPVEAVRFFASDSSYTLAHTSAEALPLTTSLGELQHRLDPSAFCRIHRSHIVRLDVVRAVRSASGGQYTAVLDDDTTLRVGRSRRDELLERLEA
jgi:DNA-binding LytR/AlgR family response regulator